MSRREPIWFSAVKLLLWAGGISLFFRFTMYLLTYLEADLRDLWMPVAGASTAFIIAWGWLLLRWPLPGYLANGQSALPTLVADANGASAIAKTKEAITMPDKPHIYIDKMMNVNHGTINHNTPGGTMNFGSVTYNQNSEVQPANGKPEKESSQDGVAGAIGDDETIDINSLVDFSERLKSPGVARNTIDNILKKAGIKPCTTEKDGRNIRYLYPRKESQAAVASYLADKNK